MTTLLSQALREAYASAPTGVVNYHTLELNHPAFDAPIRIVQNEIDIMARLEGTAPSNAYENVTFLAFGFDMTKPDVTPNSIPQIHFEIDNVDRSIVTALEAAMTSTALVTCIYREYLSTDMTEPQNDPPLKMVITEVSADAFRVKATASFPNLMNRKFPDKSYDPAEFPDLVAS